MFGFKRKYNAMVETLKQRDIEINFLVNERDALKEELSTRKKELKEAREIIERYRVLDDAAPVDCKRGPWCKACEFVKPMRTYHGMISREDYFCGKAESCKNFVQKER